MKNQFILPVLILGAFILASVVYYRVTDPREVCMKMLELEKYSLTKKIVLCSKYANGG